MSRPTRQSKSRHGQITLLIIVGVGILGVVGLAALLMGGKGSASDSNGGASDSHVVRKGGFDIVIPVSGELAAQEQIEIRNRMENQAVITYIIPEGTWALAGDELLRLNDDELKNKVNDAKDSVNLAQNAVDSAAATLSITQKEQESEVSKAELAVTLAELALSAWSEGEDPTKRSELAMTLETAQKNYKRLEERFEESKKLVDQKFISMDEFKQDEISLIEARAKLKQAELDIKVYEEYQFKQDKAQKESDLGQATAELERTRDSATAKVQSAQSDLDSKKYQLESKKERLRILEGQLAQCVQKAPSPGLVVYASSMESGMRFGNGEGPMQVGTQLWPNQLVIILPNTSRMEAAVKVSEALSSQIQVGQRATVTSDAMPDKPLTGEVTKVSVLAETGGWRDPNRRDFTVKISLGETNDAGLKPSMRCKAEIHVGRVSDALYVPLQAVFHTGPLAYVYVPQGGGFAQKKVETGRASELFAEIVAGLEEGETVLLREPESEEVVARLPLPKRDEQSAESEAEIAIGQTGMPPTVSAGVPGVPSAGGAGGRGGDGAGKSGGAQGKEGRPANGDTRPRGDRAMSSPPQNDKGAAATSETSTESDSGKDTKPAADASGDAPASTEAPAAPPATPAAPPS